MPIVRVLRPVIEVKETLVSVTCNVCGRTAPVEFHGGLPCDFHCFFFSGGYGSKFPADMENFEIVVCEACIQAWVKTFKYPDVSVGSGMFPRPTKALHTESKREMTVDQYLAFDGDEVPQEAWKWEEVPDTECDPPIKDSVWRHFKGNLYQILGLVWEWPSKEPLVHYQGLYGESQCFLRPLGMFMSEVQSSIPRFTRVSL